jgi:formate/nitrite transporter FocA (FNT family)
MKELPEASDEQTEELQPDEEDAAEQHKSPSGKIVYRAVLREADEEMQRSSAALFWSALAAGLAMGFSLITEGLLRHYLPDAPWTPLVEKFGYCIGFLIVILGRQQLFTENTLTPMLPLFRRKDSKTLANVLRLWAVVLAANLLGALAIALVVMRTNAFDPPVREEFAAIGHEAMRHGFATVALRGIFAGWLIAILVWMLPYAGSAHWFVIVVVTWVVGIGHFSHIIAGAVDVFALAWTGEKPWAGVVGNHLVPTLIGNVIGGVTLVAALNHAQVVSGEQATG